MAILANQKVLTLDYWNFDQRDLVDIDPLELFRQALLDPTPKGPYAVAVHDEQRRSGWLRSQARSSTSTPKR